MANDPINTDRKRNVGIRLIAGIVLVLGLPCAASGLTMENAFFRIELDPLTYSVRFLGAPGGPNFLDPVHLTHRQRREPGLVTPGGIMTDILPVREADAVLRRGPARVVEQNPTYLLLMGPESPSSHFQIKKEYILSPDKPELTYRLSVLSTLKEERTVTLRVTAQVLWNGVVEIPKPPTSLVRIVRGAYPGWPLAMVGENTLHIPLDRRIGREQAVLQAPVQQTSTQTSFGRWTRETMMSSAGENEAGSIMLLTLVDDASQTCQVAFEARQSGVNIGAPLVFVERWTLNFLDEARVPEMVAVNDYELDDDAY